MKASVFYRVAAVILLLSALAHPFPRMKLL
jgi:hypothetical protein